jgi:mannose-6-phosphate isomerase-like protein (cupin superfamily)
MSRAIQVADLPGVVPAETPHRFVNTGDGPLRQISIHPVPRIVQNDLD